MSETSVLQPRLGQHRSGRRIGWLLLIAAALALFVPVPYDRVQGVGTSDYRTLDSAGYDHSLAVPTTDAPRLRAGDELLGAVMRSNQAATQNEHAADRRLLALFLAVPGAFLLGRHPSKG